MLTVEHVRLSRRKGVLRVMPRCGLPEDVAAALLDDILAVVREHHGRPRGELLAALEDLRAPDDGTGRAHVERATRAARKLVLQRCAFAERVDLDPPALRDAVFRAAAAARASQGGAAFCREDVLRDVAAARGIAVADVEAGLWADLEEAHLVDAAALDGLSGASLLPSWEQAELQALLLRARRVVVDVDATPNQLRRLLRALKLHQLLFAVVPDDDGVVPVERGDADTTQATPAAQATTSRGVRLVIEGPMALFQASTRYGLKLALLLPHVVACRRYRLEAEVAVRRNAAPERLVLAGASDADAPGTEDALPPLVRGLLDELPPLLQDILPGFAVRAAVDVIAIPGHMALVPDVVVEHADGTRAYVEILGFWSRDAVWRRVELVERGLLPAPFVFCASERLRVSAEALPPDAGGALVVWKGVLSARKVAAALRDRLLPGPGSARPV